jgi:hypothetical protein
VERADPRVVLSRAAKTVCKNMSTNNSADRPTARRSRHAIRARIRRRRAPAWRKKPSPAWGLKASPNFLFWPSLSERKTPRPARKTMTMVAAKKIAMR